MPRNTPAIDYAQAVLNKYPDATAVEWMDGWRIRTPTLRKDLFVWLSNAHKSDRDRAWADAYRRIYKGNTAPLGNSK